MGRKVYPEQLQNFETFKTLRSFEPHEVDTDLETEVNTYLKSIVRPDGTYFEKNNIKHTKTVRPAFRSDNEKALWEKEEIRRCKFGYDGMTGVHYFYTNYWNITSQEGKGKQLPDWRREDAELFRLIISCFWGDNQGKGILLLGKRRIGKTNRMSCFFAWMGLFHKHIKMGMQSKTLEDASEVLDKFIKFGVNNLPDFLKVSIGDNNEYFYEFAKHIRNEKTKSREKHGNQSSVIIKAPHDSTWEGLGLRVLWFDECGKVNSLKNILNLALPCLVGNDTVTRVGVPILTGVAGDFDKFGEDFKDIWYKHNAYDLIQYFIPGWVGLYCDEFGNEDVPRAVKKIMMDRQKEKLKGEKAYYEHLQKYPLYPEEAFFQHSSSVFDLHAINKRIGELDKIPNVGERGEFQWSSGEVVWRPNIFGNGWLLEHPDKSLKNMYYAGADPIDLRQEEDGSECSLILMKKHYLSEDDVQETDPLKRALLLGNLPVYQHTQKMKNPVKFYEQSAMACIYFNQCRINVEMNRSGMISYFKDNGYTSLLMLKNSQVNYTYFKYEAKYGEFIGGASGSKSMMLEKLADYFSANCDKIFFKDLLEDAVKYDSENQKMKKDRIDAFGIALLGARKEKKTYQEEVKKNTLPNFGFKFSNGRIRKIFNE